MRRFGRTAALAVLALAATAAACGGDDGGSGGNGGSGDGGGGGTGATQLTVMSWNVLHGGRFDEVTSGALDVPTALDRVWSGMEASDPRTRMQQVAAAIAAASPDVVGLQEAARWRAEPRAGGAAVEYDLLQLVLDALAARGASYAVAAQASAIDVALPGATAAYRFTDRDVILARAGVATSAPRGGTYDAKVPVPSPLPGGGAAFGAARAWASVELQVGGRAVRFVSTHLETSEAVAAAQAAELLKIAGPDRPVVVVGDFNSGPGDPAYRVLVNDASGLRDAGAAAGADGPTCCRDSVADPAAGLDARVDLVLARGLEAQAAARVGADAASYQGGRWPSDHAGVVARLAITP